jgi:outer membrane protein OmpA-like peptidoglycan-associated protein
MAGVFAAPALAVDAELLVPVSSRSPYLTLDAAAPAGGPTPAALRVFGSAATEPLVLGARQTVVPWLATAGIAGEVSPWAPLALQVQLAASRAVAGGHTAARILDAQVGARWLWWDDGVVMAALTTSLRLPVGGLDVDDLGGSFGGGLGASATWQPTGWWRMDAEARAMGATDHRSMVLARLGTAFTPILGVTFPLEIEARTLLDPRADVGHGSPIEARGGVRWLLGPLELSAFAATGLSRGVGAPGARAVVAVGATFGAPPPPLRQTPDPEDPPPVPAPPRQVRVLVVNQDGAAVEAGVTVDTTVCARVDVGQHLCSAPHMESARATADGFATGSAAIGAASREVTIVLLARRGARPQPPSPPPSPLHIATATTTPPSPAPSTTPAPPTPKLGAVVWFATNEDVIDEEATHTLLVFVGAAKALGVTRVRLVGHTDPRGGDVDNLALSVRRAAAVHQWLQGRGLDVDASVFAHGEEDVLVPEGSDRALRPNRRVEVTAAFGGVDD